MKIPVSHGHLEGTLREPDGTLKGGAVFCHPHPIHGGTMHTKAVYRGGQALNQVGLRVLRFNFRGVGCSTGSFDDGIGEAEDVKAALDWLELGLPGGPLVVGGLSFGSMVGLTVGADDERVKALVGMGVPISHYDYSFLSDTDKPVLIIQGENDQFGSGEEVRELFASFGPHVQTRVIEGSGHLFLRHIEELQAVLREYFTSDAGNDVLGLTDPVSKMKDQAPQGPC